MALCLYCAHRVWPESCHHGAKAEPEEDRAKAEPGNGPHSYTHQARLRAWGMDQAQEDRATLGNGPNQDSVGIAREEARRLQNRHTAAKHTSAYQRNPAGS